MTYHSHRNRYQRDPNNEMGARLRLLRAALGLSQVELCRHIGINAAAWNNVETGDNRIGLDNALQLCRTLGVTLDWIYRGDVSGLPQSLAAEIARVPKRPGPAKRPRAERAHQRRGMSEDRERIRVAVQEAREHLARRRA